MNHQIQKNLEVKLFPISAMVCTLSKTKRAHFINVVSTNFDFEKSFQLLLVVYQMIKDTIFTTRGISQRDKLNDWRTI